MRTDNSIHIVPAAKQRHELTRSKAIAALHELDRAGTMISFETIAAPAGGSHPWLYTQPDFNHEIVLNRELVDEDRRLLRQLAQALGRPRDDDHIPSPPSRFDNRSAR